MKRLAPALLAIVFFALPAAALADSFKIGNLTDKSLTFSLRCKDSTDTWHTFKLGSFQSREYLSGDWDYSCDTERYQLRIGTTQDDGSVIYKTVNVSPGNNYALVNSRNVGGYTAYNTDYLVAMHNDTRVTVHVGYSCTSGADGSGEASASPAGVSWFYIAQCDQYKVVTTTRESDGSETSFSKTLQPNNIYKIVWNEDRRVYELQKI